MMCERKFIQLFFIFILGFAYDGLLAQSTLYNGIQLPKEWPPKNIEMLSREPMPVPYLENPPSVIPIDVGRQLFVDDFLIAETSLKRRWYRPTKYKNNPVLKPERDYEGSRTTLKCSPVLYDPEDNLFKVWYSSSLARDRALAVSKDGIHWKRPKLDVVPGKNHVIYNPKWYNGGFDVALDHNATNPEERYKSIYYEKNIYEQNIFFHSPDGVHWKEIGKAPRHIDNIPGMAGRKLGNKKDLRFHPGDVCTFYWNPFRKIWVFDVKEHYVPVRGRARFYREAKTFAGLMDIHAKNLVFSMGSDKLDKLYPGIENPKKVVGFIKATPQMYSRDAIAYESLMLGTFAIWYNQFPDRKKIPKITQLFAGFSRDGFHWDRENREPFIPIEREKGVGHHEFGYLRPAGGGCVVVKEKLYFYYEATSGLTREGEKAKGETQTINLAILRRDGFAAMEAGAEVGILETRPVLFNGEYLFVNVDAPRGELKVEILDAEGEVIAPFSLANVIPVKRDKTKVQIKWKNTKKLSDLRGKPVRFRFHLRNGSLYAFWVSQWKTGESAGYLASGGSDYKGNRDIP